MAVPIKLGAHPKQFARIIEFKNLDGTESKLPIIFKYRTRTEYTAWVEAQAQARLDAVKAEGMAEDVENKIDQEVSELQGMVESWTLDDYEFNAANIKLLCNELPQAVTAIFITYRDACMFGRLGN